MTAIRTGFPPPVSPQTPQQAGRPLDPGRAAAQRAFFAAALGQAPAAPEPTPAPAPGSAQARIPDPAGEPPKRILRPGSLLDIRV